MTLTQIEARARALYPVFTDQDQTDSIDALLETLENLTDRQRKDARILQQMVAFLARLEAGISAK